MQKPSKGQISPAPGKAGKPPKAALAQAAGRLRGKGKRPKEERSIERVGFTLAPGNELHIDFGLVRGKVVISYPAGENPVVKVYNTDDGEPKVFELQRARLLPVLERMTQ